MTYTFRNLVNKRSTPATITGELLEIIGDVGTNRTARLNEAIAEVSGEYTTVSLYTVISQDPYTTLPVPTDQYLIDYEKSVITFFNTFTALTVYADYTGIGSVVWAEDVTDAYTAINDLSATGFSKDGSVAMTGNLNLGDKNIMNVNTIDGVNITGHTHTGGADGAVLNAASLGQGSVTTDKLATDSVTSIKIAQGAVTNAKIASTSITTDKLVNNVITAEKLAPLSVSNNHIIDDAISTAKIAANTLGQGLQKTGGLLGINTDSETVTVNLYNQLAVVVSSFIPIGATILYPKTIETLTLAGATWAICNGKLLAITNYPELYTLIGHTFKDGAAYNTSVYFRLPNMGSTLGALNALTTTDIRVATGSSSVYTTGTTGGEAGHVLTVDEMPKHKHTLTSHGTGGGGSSGGDINRDNTQGAYENTTEVGGNVSHNNMQPFIAYNYFIRIK